MIISLQGRSTAWLPLTPRGVAAFAQAPLSRLLAVQFVFALGTGIAIVWFLSTCWFPTIQAAIKELPARGSLQSGRLRWTEESPRLLADGKFVAFGVDLDHTRRIASSADVQVEFGRETIRITSLFGYGEWAYPKDLSVAFNRSELQPWWGAWEPPLLWIGVGISAIGLMAEWAMLATAYFLPVWLVGFFANRNLGRVDSWQLAGAALMPGDALLVAGIICYGLGLFDLVKVLALVAGQFAVGWVFLLISPFFAPRAAPATPVEGNPFVSKTDERIRR